MMSWVKDPDLKWRGDDHAASHHHLSDNMSYWARIHGR
jgi:hypothetical protein